MKKYAYLFPGQGAQVVGMLKDICQEYPQAAKVLDDVSKITSVDMKKLLWDSEQSVLSRSDNSQLAITSASIAVMKVLEEKGILPSAAMGFSLGEFPALYASGVLSFEDVIKLVRQRGLIMQKVCDKIAEENQGNPPGMTAVMGLAPEKVLELADSISDAYAANMNSPVQTVVSGTAAALEKLEVAAKEAGARRALRLQVAGPFHSPLMMEAAVEFEKALEEVTFNAPKIPLFSNVTGGQVSDPEEIKKNALLHLTKPVLWTKEEAALAEMMDKDSENQWSLLEPGVGEVLTGLWKKIPASEKYSCLGVNSVEGISSIN